MQVVIIRGLPGSGKSTIAKLFSGYEHFEADQYFYTEDGKYNYVPSKVKDAHADCNRRVREALKSGKNVVISNTFTRIFEFEPYLKMCKEFQIEPNIIESQGKFKNIHGVSEEAILRMKARWESH